MGESCSSASESGKVMTDARWNWYGEGEDQPLEVRRSKVLDQEEKARKGMNTPNIYKAKFWIFEEKRYGTWEESQEFYRSLDEEKRVQTTEAYIRQHLSSRPSSGTSASGDLRRRLVED